MPRKCHLALSAKSLSQKPTYMYVGRAVSHSPVVGGNTTLTQVPPRHPAIHLSRALALQPLQATALRTVGGGDETRDCHQRAPAGICYRRRARRCGCSRWGRRLERRWSRRQRRRSCQQLSLLHRALGREEAHMCEPVVYKTATPYPDNFSHAGETASLLVPNRFHPE